jgi:hypothetical protein
MDSDERREPLARIPIRTFEVDQRIVAAVHGRSYYAGRAEIYAYLHSYTCSVLKQWPDREPSYNLRPEEENCPVILPVPVATELTELNDQI